MLAQILNPLLQHFRDLIIALRRLSLTPKLSFHNLARACSSLESVDELGSHTILPRMCRWSHGILTC
jgi:hypothetical protein